jgi:allantoinase
MSGADLVLRARRAVLPDGEREAVVVVRDGRIVAVETGAHALASGRDLDAGTVVDVEDDAVLLPGLVDTHVHCNEPGRTHWEGFGTATRAAAAGGITTIVDMPLNSVPPTTSVEALWVKRAAATGRVHVDVGFWAGAVPDNLDDLLPLLGAGALGVKAFLCGSGVAEFGALDPELLEPVLARLSAADGLLLVHAEDPEVLARSARRAGRSYAAFLAGRPPEAETEAVGRVAAAARRTGGRAHVVHLAAAEAVTVLADAQRAGARISGETCPHYLTFDAGSIPDGATAFKCCPPIRDAGNREGLWQGLRSGVLASVVSDHSPSPPDLKALGSGDLDAAWSGIASLQVALPAVWTEARHRDFGLPDVVRWMASGPADLAGLTRKGRIAPGRDADFCVFAPDESAVVDPARLHHRHPVTPYAGRRLQGRIRTTYLRGRGVDGRDPAGRLLVRGAS